ncbi:ABC transporter permease [Dyadobacter sp. OTU695]|uniref:ABC transporter permease n=1 Tax=Dyadobacter sp. OTU695 TaxID=3043860 RepID=UPI00313E7FE1
MRPSNNLPPRWAERLIERIAAPYLREEILGDLFELFQKRVTRFGHILAQWMYVLDIILLIHPRLWRKNPETARLPHYSTDFSKPNPIDMLSNYMKVAARNLKTNKAYALINIAGLALGMSCAILIFMLVRYHLSFDNFHAGSERIYRIVTEQHRDNISYQRSVPAPLGKAFRNDYTFAEKVARIATFEESLITLRNGNELRKFKDELAYAEADFFEIFNFPLLQGNKATALEAPGTAIITEKIAEKYFAHENPIGKVFWLDNKIAFTVTGILKDLPENSDRKTGIYVSYNSLKALNPWLASDDSWGGIQSVMQCFVRLRPGVTVAQVEKVFPAYVKRYRPTSKNVHHYKLQHLADIHFDSRYDGPMERRNLWILSVIGLFLIATACVNFVNLATAQAFKRSKEVGVRKVLGGLKGQLFWQFLSETFLISTAAIIIALVLTYLVLPAANSFFDIRMSINLLSDRLLLTFVMILGILVTFFAGSYPGLVLARFQPIAALKGKMSQASIGGFNTRRTLIVIQFAISQILIIGMVVIINQMRYANQADLGFDKDAIVMLPLGIDSTNVKMKTLKSEISEIAGVEKISLCFSAPASWEAWNNSIRFDNQSEEVNFPTSIKAGDADYISTFGLELAAGRNIFPTDSVREFLVNETFTRKLNFKTPQDAIGKVIAANGGTMVAPIVGVVKDFHDRSFHEDINAIAFTSFIPNYSVMAIKVNLANIKYTMSAIEKTWTAKYPDQIFESQFLDDSIGRFYETEERMLKLIQVFSFIAIFIGALGLYGLVSFMAAQKTKEIGIRKVLGSSISEVLWIFGKEFSTLILIAFAIAAPVAWWVMNGWLQDFKFQIKIDVWVFILTLASTFLIVLVTVLYKALKAVQMDPVKSLRSE